MFAKINNFVSKLGKFLLETDIDLLYPLFKGLTLNKGCYLTEAFVQRCSVKKMFLKISLISLENTCARVPFFDKVAGLLY